MHAGNRMRRIQLSHSAEWPSDWVKWCERKYKWISSESVSLSKYSQHRSSSVSIDRIIEVNENYGKTRITPNWNTKQHFFHTWPALCRNVVIFRVSVFVHLFHSNVDTVRSASAVYVLRILDWLQHTDTLTRFYQIESMNCFLCSHRTQYRRKCWTISCLHTHGSCARVSP